MDKPGSNHSITVVVPQALREKTGGRKVVTVSGHTIRETIDMLDHDFPGMKFHLCFETGELRPFVNLFLNGENIRYLHGLDTPVREGATVYILPSVAGGASH